MILKDDLSFREVRPEEFNLIRSSFLQSSHACIPSCYTEKKYHYSKKSKYIENHIHDSGVRITLLYNRDNPGVVIGYIIYTPYEIPFIHYLYVKYVYRNFGLGTLLVRKVVNDAEVFHTDHLPFSGKNSPGMKQGGYLKWSKFKFIYQPEGIIHGENCS